MEGRDQNLNESIIMQMFINKSKNQKRDYF